MARARSAAPVPKTGSSQATSGRTSRSARPQGSRLEAFLKSAPARVMEPRVQFIGAVAALVIIGLIMVFSASSIRNLEEGTDPYAMFSRQVLFAAVGLVVLLLVSRVDYHFWCQPQVLKVLWGVSVLVLLITRFMGTASHGASRWLTLGPIALQPSEFVKIVVVISAANLFPPYVEAAKTQGAIGALKENRALTLALLAGIVIPMLLILIQPDKGTTLVVGATLMAMLLMAGTPPKVLGVLVVVALVAFVALGLKDDYSRQRLMAMLDPNSDPNGSSYQLLQSLYAFGGGGFAGVGLGLSRQKYSYLPEAHNDFILAVLGEETGFVGMVVLMALFALLLYAGFRIARDAPDVAGQLIASGCTLLLVVSFLLNLFGVIGIAPMTGKAVPFLSSGGSSMIASMLGAAMVLGVSHSSRLPETVHDRRRSAMRTVEAPAAPAPASAPVPRTPRVEGSTAGEPTARSLRLVSGGARPASRASDSMRAPADRGTGINRERSHGDRGPSRERDRSADRGGWERVDLGRDDASRLRDRSRRSGDSKKR